MANRCAVATPVGKLQCEVWDDPDHPQLVLYWNDREIAVVDVEMSTEPGYPRVFTWSASRHGGPIKGVRIFPGYGENVGVVKQEEDPALMYTPLPGAVTMMAEDGVHVKTVDEFKQVVIPVCHAHKGKHSVLVTLQWRCPACGGPRGEIRQGCSLDGAKTLPVNDWENPCGHLDVFYALREEAAGNGRNPHVVLPSKPYYLGPNNGHPE